MSGLQITVGTLYLVVVLLVKTLYGTPAFLGGAMTFTLEDNPNGTVKAHMQVLAGWRLGTGPCGWNCSRLHTNQPTNRQLTESTVANSSLFGNYIKNGLGLNKEERNSFNETIISVNEQLGWEQEVMTFLVELHPNSEREKVVYRGQSWINLTIQGQNIPWNFQTTMNTNTRNDTKQRNRSPKIKLNPYYRIDFDQTSYIDLPVVDDDDDRILCELPAQLEIGQINRKPAKGITVFENCTVKINATTGNNYTGDDWIAVTVEVKETNKNPLLLGSTIVAPSKSFLSKLQIQFAVHVQRNLPKPKFVPKTPEPLHSFVVYAGATWNTVTFAESTNGPVKEFIVSGTMLNTWDISDVKPDSIGRENTFQSNIKLADPMYETGQNIACITASNENGGESLESRCFRIIVKDSNFNYTTARNNNEKPYFVNMPGPNDIVKCPIDDTCIVPIYVKSKRNVTIIDSTRSDMEYTGVLQQISIISFNGEIVYKTDLSVRNSLISEVIVCLQATDYMEAKSDELCIKFVVIPPDPCIFAPCLNGQCVFKEDTGTFTCNCKAGITGRLCDRKINTCDSNSCVHGTCLRNDICYCSDDGYNPNDYAGRNCTEKINDCPTTRPCNDNGICEDGFQNYTCHCFGGFVGNDCETNTCVSTGGSCANDKCPEGFCQQGACSSSVCYCGMGYSGAHCEQTLDVRPNTTSNGDVKIIKPTISNGDMILCSERNHFAHDCMFDIYIAYQAGINNLKVRNTSADLGQSVNCTTFRQPSLFHGIVSMYVMRCYLNGAIQQKDGQYVCLTVEAGEHAHDTMCYEFEFVPDQARKKRQAPLKSFVPPTPLTRSRFPVTVNESNTILLFTTTNNGVCEEIKPTSSFIHLLLPVNRPDVDGKSVCMTEMVVRFNETGSRVIGLKYGEDERIYTFLVTGGNVRGPCESPNICQNDGVCFAHAENSHTCICRNNYIGLSCERGPCHNTNTCQNGGHCFVNNSVTTCVCQPGYDGQFCSNDIVANTLHENTWPVIDRTSGIVRNISCIAGKKCEVYAFVIYSSRPQVALGYTSKGIDACVEIFETDAMRGIYQVRIGMVSKLAVNHTVCLQTFDNDRTNKDEVCFDVNVTQDTNVYVWPQDQPHFVSPSLQSDSIVECVTGKQCRVSYTATPGHGYDTKCISASLSTDVPIIPFEHVIYSSCELCQDNKTANTYCTFDVVFVPTSYITVEKIICLTLSLRGLPQIEGEQRCFKVANPIRARGLGCRNFPCQNKGFCDGHVVDKPVCYCRKGYSGQTCEISSASTNSNACIKQFLGKNNLNFTCKAGETCSFPVEVCGANSMTMELAYDSAVLDVTIDTDTIIGIDNCCLFRKIHVKSNTAGTRMFCVQMSDSSGTIEDEFCPHVHIYEDSPVNIDKAKPHFVFPTLPKATTFVCKVREVCHLLMYFVASDVGKTSSCPALKDTSPNEIKGLHVFQPEVSNDYCVSDVSFSYDSKGTLPLCLQVLVTSKKGEERCFQIRVVEDSNVPKEMGLCKGITCFGKGVCVANFNNTQNCTCPKEYDGPDCSIHRTTTEQTIATSSPTPTSVSYQTTTATRMSIPNTSPTTSPHGMHGTGCYGNPCIRGVCYVHLDEYFCLCPSGFEGLNCQIDADECRSQPCKNGGTCEDDVDNFVCHCVHGYTGKLCDTEIDECVSQPCQHGGKCVDGLNHYTCMCLDGFDGGHCQNVLDPCYDSPCMRGTCFSHLSLFVCLCPPGFSGKFCEKGQGACDSHPCHNGATCTQNATSFMCTCPLGFEGSLCQKDIDECSSNPCRNNGICHDEAGGFRCECPHGYSGLQCSNGNERKCFSCQGLGTNVTCNRVTTCNSDEVCYVESSSTSNAHSFSVGCRRKSECINSTTNNCTHCCDKDYCNDGGCGLAGYPSRHQRGPICFDCDDMADMSMCTQVTACAHNQKCTTYGSQLTGYDGKCITQNTQCGFTGGNGFCQSCCSDDFCNYNCRDSYASTTVVMP